MNRAAFTQRIAEFFKLHPFEWVDARELEIVGGRQAWRTRVSDARRQFGMDIENRCTKQKADDGTAWTRSEYRYRPARLF